MANIEHVGGRSEIVLNRNRNVNSMKHSHPVFTLTDLEEFIIHARVAGVDDDEALWFRRSGKYGQSPDVIFFPTDSTVYGPVSTKPARRLSPAVARSMLAVLLTIAFILGAVIF